MPPQAAAPRAARRRLAVVAAAVLAAVPVVAGACGGDGATGDEERAAGAGERFPLTVSIERERLFEASRAFRVVFANIGDEAVEVSGAELRSELFAPVGPDARTFTVRPTGGPVSMPLPYGEATCGDGRDDGLVVRLAIDGAVADVALGAAPRGIRRVHETECAAARVREAVDLGFGTDWRSVAPGRVTGTVTVAPRGDAEVAVEEVRTAIVLSAEVTSELPAAGDVEVVVTAARCDAHALTESKKTFVFSLLVSVDGAEPARVELEAEAGGAARQALDRAIDECVAARTGH